MRKACFLILLVPALSLGQPQQSLVSPQELIKTLAREWRGTSTGDPGNGTVERSYEFLFGGTFLQATNKSTYPPQEKNPKGETHHDIGLFSYDKQRDKLILRQFHGEGFVNEYVQETVAPDHKKISFVTERIENIAPGCLRRKYLHAERQSQIEKGQAHGVGHSRPSSLVPGGESRASNFVGALR